MAAVLHDVDVLVVPSMWIENAPFIIREAFAAGVPVIASNLGGMAEMVKDGVDGLLFPPGDAVSLGGCLRRLIEERRPAGAASRRDRAADVDRGGGRGAP